MLPRKIDIYLRSHNKADMYRDLLQLVRENPGRTLLIAAVTGFLFGRAMFRT